MSRPLLALVSLLISFSVPAFGAGAQPAPAPTPDRAALVKYRPYREAVREARRTGRRLLLFFTNPHCVPCYWLEAEIFCKPDSAELINREFVPVRFIRKLGPNDDTPETPEATRVARLYGVNATPLVIVALPTGRSVGAVAWLGRNEVLYRLRSYATATPPASTPPIAGTPAGRP